MSLTEEKSIDKIEVVENGTIQVREVTRIMKDGEVFAQKYHRWSFNPGSDVSFMPNNVQEIAKVTWTKEVVDNFKYPIVTNTVVEEKQ